uniref:Uncharacterized protein LOC114345474 n=1 Tax=Diabrotica virgifera virgifera TaxID=50390 RepID=A0A6P7GQB9_DIAVI
MCRKKAVRAVEGSRSTSSSSTEDEGIDSVNQVVHTDSFIGQVYLDKKDRWYVDILLDGKFKVPFFVDTGADVNCFPYEKLPPEYVGKIVACDAIGAADDHKLDTVGMTDRAQENEITPSRLASLTGFQVKILRHALTKFPSAKRVVYSTCSIMAEENEDVVRQVLETNYNFKLISASQFVGETWHSFGSSDYGDIGKFCLYAKPDSDYTNGFFVAIFERLQEAEENQFFNTRIFNFKKHVQENEKWKLKKQKKYNQNLTNIEFGENHAHQTGNRKENKKMQNVHINKDGKQNDKCSNNSKKHNQNEVIPKYKQNKTKNYTDDASTELEKYENINILEKEENLKIKRKVAKADHDNLESKQLKKSKNKKTKSFDLQIDCERLENRTPECIGKTSIISNNKKSKKFKQVDIGLGSDIIASKHVGVTNESKINTKKIKRQNIAETIDVDKETEIISKKRKKKSKKVFVN